MWADSAPQSEYDIWKMFLTDRHGLFKKISLVQREKGTRWQEICLYHSTAVYSAHSMNSWFEPPNSSQGHCLLQVRNGFPTQMGNCWIVSCELRGPDGVLVGES